MRPCCTQTRRDHRAENKAVGGGRGSRYFFSSCPSYCCTVINSIVILWHCIVDKDKSADSDLIQALGKVSRADALVETLVRRVVPEVGRFFLEGLRTAGGGGG